MNLSELAHIVLHGMQGTLIIFFILLATFTPTILVVIVGENLRVHPFIIAVVAASLGLASCLTMLDICEKIGVLK